MDITKRMDICMTYMKSDQASADRHPRVLLSRAPLDPLLDPINCKMVYLVLAFLSSNVAPFTAVQIRTSNIWKFISLYTA